MRRQGKCWKQVLCGVLIAGMMFSGTGVEALARTSRTISDGLGESVWEAVENDSPMLDEHLSEEAFPAEEPETGDSDFVSNPGTEMMEIESSTDETGLISLGNDEVPNFGAGSGTEGDPFLISTIAQLEKMREFYSQKRENLQDFYFKLTQDITFSDDLEHPTYVWKPIIGDSRLHFNGNHHRIYNMYIEADESDIYANQYNSKYMSLALFRNAGSVENLTIENAKIYCLKISQENIQSLPIRMATVVCEASEIADCDVKGTVQFLNDNETYYDNEHGTYRNWDSDIGVVAYKASSVKNCTVSANVTATHNDEMGGIVYDSFSVSDCHLDGTIHTDGLRLAGITITSSTGAAFIGNTKSVPHLENCDTSENCVLEASYQKRYKDSTSRVFGISAWIDSVINCSNAATIIAESDAVGITGGGSVIKNCVNSGKLQSKIKHCLAGIVYSVVPGSIVTGNRNTADLSDTAENSYVFGITSSVAGESGAETVFSDNQNEGNLHGYYAAGIVSSVNGSTVDECFNTGDITGVYKAAGIALNVGDYNRSAEESQVSVIRNCGNEGKVTGANAAGIAGEAANATIMGCYNNGAIKAERIDGLQSGCAAGVVREVKEEQDWKQGTTSITGCKNQASIWGCPAAGIAASFGAGIISRCSNTGTIAGDVNGSSNAHLGGITGELSGAAAICDCFNAGTIDCGKVNWGYGSGGIAGKISTYMAEDTVSVIRCYHAGEISFVPSGSNKVGSIVGMIYTEEPASFGDFKTGGTATVHDCYYLEGGAPAFGSSNHGTDCIAEERSDAQLKQQTTFTGWDFAGTWEMGSAEYAYPILREETTDAGFVITFDAGEGSFSDGKKMMTGETRKSGKLLSLPIPKLDGKKFAGWYMMPEGGERVTTNTVFERNTTIYAQWVASSSEKRVAIRPVSPENGAHGVAYINAGNTVSLEIIFTTDIPIKDIKPDNSNFQIVDYDTDETVFEVKHKNSVKITPSESGSRVAFHFSNAGLSYNKKYYIKIEENLLVFEDETCVAFTEKDDWCFKTGTRVRYLDEQVKNEDIWLPYWFDIATVDFARSSYDYNWELAMVAYGMALGAFESASGRYENGAYNAEQTLKNFGFDHFARNDGYRKKPTADSIGVCAASRRMSVDGMDYTVIALPVRGAGYEGEWASNVTVDTNNYHRGFKNAAEDAMRFLRDYITNPDNQVTGSIKVIVTGYSRAGGVANVIASLLDDGSLSDLPNINLEKQDIYGFCFEPPAVTTRKDAHDGKYRNISCFINPKDFVPKVPSYHWDYRRFGNEYYYPDKTDVSSVYKRLYPDFLKNYKSLSGTEYNQTSFCPTCGDESDLRWWIQKLIGGVSQSICRNDFVRDIQPVARDLLQYGLDDHPMEELMKKAVILEDDGKWIRFVKVLLYAIMKSSKEVPGVMSFLGMYSGNLNVPSEENGSYPGIRETLYETFRPTGVYIDGAINLYETFRYGQNGKLIAQEHYPLVNLAWHLTCRDEKYYTDGSSRYLIINCPVNVTLYDTETGLPAAKIVDGKSEVIDNSPVLPFIDENEQKVFIVPTDRSYRVEVVATDEGEVTCSMVEYSESSGYTKRTDYLDIAVHEGDVLRGTIDTENKCTLSDQEGEILVAQTQDEITWFDVELVTDDLGTAFGSGQYMKNSYLQVQATPVLGAEFDGWYKGSELVSRDEEYRFRVDESIMLTAKFKEIDGVQALQIPDQEYTGKAIKPEVTLNEGVRKLIKGKDYTVGYKNNKNAYPYTDEDYAAWEASGKAVAPHDGTVGFDPKKAPQAIVKMKGSYSGTKAVYFRILPIDITGKAEAEDIVVLYNGKQQKPVPTLTCLGRKLKLGKDYFIPEYDAAKSEPNAFCAVTDTPCVLTLTGKGNYTGNHRISLTIASKTNGEREQLLLSSVKVAAIPAQNYIGHGEAITAEKLLDKNGKPWTLTVKGKNNRLLKEGTDFRIAEYRNNTDIGKATMILQGLQAVDSEIGYSYVGTKAVSFQIVGKNLKNAKIDVGTRIFAYTGEKISPQGYSVSWQDGTELKEGEDYAVRVENNLRAGMATVSFTGMGAYTGQQKKTFRIEKKHLSKGDQIHVPDIIVTGESELKAPYEKGGAKPHPVIVWQREEREAITLIEGTDYSLTYTNNDVIKSGKTPMIKVNGRGSFDGSFTIPFAITPVELSSLSAHSYAPDKEASSKPGAWQSLPVITDSNGKKLRAGVDFDGDSAVYELLGSYFDSGAGESIWLTEGDGRLLEKTEVLPAGSLVRVTVAGKGFYDTAANNTLSAEYRILPKGTDISKASFKLSGNIPFNGRAVTLHESDFISVHLGKSVKLKFGEDYIIDETSYTGNDKAGTARVTICGRGAYGGRKTITFQVGTRRLSDVFRGFIRRL